MTIVVRNGYWEQGFKSASSPNETREYSTSYCSLENLAKNMQDPNTFNSVDLLFKQTQFISSSPISCNSLSFLGLLIEEKKPCPEVEIHSKKGITSAPHNYSPVFCCDYQVPGI